MNEWEPCWPLLHGRSPACPRASAPIAVGLNVAYDTRELAARAERYINPIGRDNGEGVMPKCQVGAGQAQVGKSEE